MEKTLYSDTNIQITNNRIITNDRTFFINSISSVRVKSESIWPFWPTFWIIIGIIILVVSGFTAWYASLMFIIVGGVNNFYVSEYWYSIILGTNSGEIVVMTSKDGNYITTIRGKIEEAMVSKSEPQ